MPAGPSPADFVEQRFSVTFEYPVAFCNDGLLEADSSLAWSIARREPERRHPLGVVIDEGLARAQPELSARVVRYARAHERVLELRGEPIVVPGGEAVKNDLRLATRLQATFAEARLDRQSVVLIVGGGAVLDAAGFAASTVHRGVRVVRMPSTVLSQCDGGVGVKTGVNAHASKNFIGTFAPPHAVLNDFALLRTLPLREARAGMAEAVKVALIKDPGFFAWLESKASALSNADPECTATLVRRAAGLHLRHIAEGGDPFETGSARPLDYGHWLAHRLEILSGHELRHGEAVAIGMLLDARYAERSGFLKREDFERICALLSALGLPRQHPALTERAGDRLAALRGLEEFREHLGGTLTITLLSAIGRGFEVNAIDEKLMAESIAWLASGEPS